ncbi:WD40/YVTN/BNR-like repeat-containing protein [Paenibacillus daejeonensis]|uniref:WD40/YVTN/BNR-like repeat-containing protein n=1 Tax=Paenibacillus daejeonensis TaxID=135193 RepID=UPI00035F4E21|nr:hypothetical protein [Paenibacillus daejeonensis]
MRKHQSIWTSMLLLILVALVAAGCTNSGPGADYTSAAGSSSDPPAIGQGSDSEEQPSGEAVDEEVTNPPEAPITERISGTVTALRLADDQTAWIGGEGWIARTSDGGATWTTQLEHGFTVDQIFALNDKVAWASLRTGDNQPLKLMHTKDGGDNWSETGTLPHSGFFHFTSAKEGFSENAHTLDGGKTWTRINVPQSVAFPPYFHDKDHGWAVTTAHEGSFDFVRTTDGGQTWHVVYSRDTDAPVHGAVIRSTGQDDAWVQMIGDSGMSQTSYSLFHLGSDGKWIPVLAHDGAGSGPAPGFAIQEETGVPRGAGTSPGALYVVNPEIAFMGGQCMACEDANTLGKTTDGGATWSELEAAWPGYGPQLLAALDEEHIWLVTTDHEEASALYTSDDGGSSWKNIYTFE